MIGDCNFQGQSSLLQILELQESVIHYLQAGCHNILVLFHQHPLQHFNVALDLELRLRPYVQDSQKAAENVELMGQACQHPKHSTRSGPLVFPFRHSILHPSAQLRVHIRILENKVEEKLNQVRICLKDFFDDFNSVWSGLEPRQVFRQVFEKGVGGHGWRLSFEEMQELIRNLRLRLFVRLDKHEEQVVQKLALVAQEFRELELLYLLVNEVQSFFVARHQCQRVVNLWHALFRKDSLVLAFQQLTQESFHPPVPFVLQDQSQVEIQKSLLKNERGCIRDVCLERVKEGGQVGEKRGLGQSIDFEGVRDFE